MARNQRDITSDNSTQGLSAYTVTNLTVDRALNADANSDLATADVLGTLINDLFAAGIIGK